MHSAKHLAFCAIVSAAVAVPCAARPFGMVFDHASAPWNAMKDRELRAAADAVRTNAAETVTAKGMNPPSGDKHDYMSFGPYWWPDPTKPDGLPYVRRDGETNPGSLADSDRPRLERMVDGVEVLAAAAKRFKDHAAGAEAARRLSSGELLPMPQSSSYR